MPRLGFRSTPLRRLLASLTSLAIFVGSLSLPLLTTAVEASPPSELPHMLFFLPDHLGSTNVVTDEHGNVVQVIEYKPFGEVYRTTGPGHVSHTFTGQRQDPATGLTLFPGRPYDPSLGRFLQPDPFVQDPADPQSLNRYAYVRNNPVNLVDPSGYSFKKWFKKYVQDQVIRSVVKLFFPGEGPSQEVVARSANAGYEAYQAGQNPWRAATIEAAVVYTEYATAGAVFGLTEDPTAAYRASRAAGQSVRASLEEAWQEGEALAQDLGVSAGRAMETVAQAYASPLGTNLTNAALRGGADRLSQLPSRPLGLATGAGLAGTGALGDDAATVLSRSPVNKLTGLGNVLTVSLAVLEVHQTYQDPNLTLAQQNERAGIQVGALAGKFMAGRAIEWGVTSVLGISAGGPLMFGMVVVGTGVGVTGIDKVKTFLLRSLKLQQ